MKDRERGEEKIERERGTLGVCAKGRGRGNGKEREKYKLWKWGVMEVFGKGRWGREDTSSKGSKCIKSYVVAVAVGVWIGGAYFFTSSTSFANPMVSIARTLSDTFAGIAPSSAPAFVAAQVLGAFVAVPIIRLLFEPATPSRAVTS